VNDRLRLSFLGRYYRRVEGGSEAPGFRWEALDLPVEQAAFLLVDVQSGYEGEKVEEDASPLGRWWREATGRIAQAQLAARGVGMPIVYANNSAPRVGIGHSEFGAHFRRSWGVDFDECFAEGGVDAREYHGGRAGRMAFPDELRPQEQDYLVRKHAYSAFYDSRLDSLLRNLGTRTLICAGIWADCCLLTTSLDALYRNYRVVWLRDGTMAGEDPGDEKEMPFTRRMIRWFETAVGFSVTCEEFVQACNALRNGVVQEGGSA